MARISCIHKTATSSSAAGGPYSTIAGWHSSCDRATNGEEIGVICDDAAYDEMITLNKAVSGTNMLRLTSNDADLVYLIDGSPAPDVRPTGPFRDGARIVSTGSTPSVTIDVSYAAVDHLSIVQNGTGDSCVRVTGQRTNIALAYCAMEVQANIAGSSCVLLDTQSAVGTILVGGCAFYGYDLAAIYREQGATTGNHSGKVDLNEIVVTHCAGYADDADDSLAAFIFVAHNSTSSPGDTTVISVENCIGGWVGQSSTRQTSFADGTTSGRGTPNGVMTWNGSNNFDDGAGYADIDGTDNLTSWVEGSTDPSTVDTTQSTGSYWVVSDLTAPADFRLLDAAAGNAVVAAGLASDSLALGTTAQQAIYDQTRDLRGYTYDPNTPDLGPFSYEDHSTLDFIKQGISI